MASQQPEAPRGTARSYRWLGVAGAVTLALAAVFLALAVHHAREEKRARADVGARAAEMMNRIEAEAARMENEAAQP